MRAPLAFDAARVAADAVIAAGRSEGLHLAVAVVDRGGITRVLLADDGVGPVGIETARRKAYTAAVMGTDTALFAQFAVTPALAAAPPHLIDSQLLAVPGGLPIVVDGAEVIGGIGVGGADGDTDAKHAASAIEAVTELLDRPTHHKEQ
ncbi:heme-binding protein [Streptomyces sp. NPDC004629]|uniref:GlcG/HbpS family heme-binding protein n=1 Tax=Streptomyces sp. NPDC004629 TaxID=3364705 RepID=UPI0036BA217C